MSLIPDEPADRRKRRGRNPNLSLIVYSGLCVVMYHGASAFLLDYNMFFYARFLPLVVYAVVLIHEWPREHGSESSDAEPFSGQSLLLAGVMLAVVPFEYMVIAHGELVVFSGLILTGQVIYFIYASLRLLDAKSEDSIRVPVFASVLVITLSSLAFYSFVGILAMSV